MLVVHFQGWFQCRLATNPDPSDEPRGVSGYTFALAGEPDLDRIIRLSNAVALRSHGPTVGVHVSKVSLNGHVTSTHPLLGATVHFDGDPRFESRNLILSEDKSGVGIIHPFHFRISGEQVSLSRRDILNPSEPESRLHQVPPELVARRAPAPPGGLSHDLLKVGAATGIFDPVAARIERRRLLQADLATETDELGRLALGKRISELEILDPGNVRVLSYGFVQTRRFNINGPAVIDDPAGTLGCDPDPETDWPLEFWMGGWDADAMCGFLSGVVRIPSRTGQDVP